jgi:hypothetical protein
VIEKILLRRIFGHKKDEMMEGWRSLHIKDMHDLYSSPTKIRIIKSRRMSWAGHLAQIGEKKNVYTLQGRKMENTSKTKTKIDR